MRKALFAFLLLAAAGCGGETVQVPPPPSEEAVKQEEERMRKLRETNSPEVVPLIKDAKLPDS